LRSHRVAAFCFKRLRFFEIARVLVRFDHSFQTLSSPVIGHWEESAFNDGN
jgi:hypothetical protein